MEEERFRRMSDYPNRNQMNENDMNNIIRESKDKELFYDENITVLSKYAHLKIPEDIRAEVEYISKPNRDSIGNGVSVVYSVSFSHSQFFSDSFNNAHIKGKPCPPQPLNEYWTTFRSMNTHQTKWYFFWRSEALRGNFLDADLSYIILFTYELLNYSFNQNAAFNVSMLVRLYENYIAREPKLDNYLPQWISDFLIEMGEIELSGEWGKSQVSQHGLYDKLNQKRDELQKISITNWKPFIRNYRETEFFISNKNKVYNVFKGGIAIMDEILKEEGKDIVDEWFNVKLMSTKRLLYSSAVIGRTVLPVEVEQMVTYTNEILYKQASSLIRVSENVARLAMGEKRQIKEDDSVLPEGLKDRMIDLFVTSGKNKVSERFVKVRNGDKETVGSAIPRRPVNEEVLLPQPRFELNLEAVEEARRGNEDFTNIYKDLYEETDSEEEVAATTVVQDVDSNTHLSEVNSETNALENLFQNISGDEEQFIEELNEVEIQLLMCFQKSNQSIVEINRFAKAKGISASVLVASINDKAIELLGDVLIEQAGDEYVVIDEYEQLMIKIKGDVSD